MRLIPLLSFAALATACGGDGGDVSPTLIPGGGVTDPGIDGVVNVYVIDDATDLPIGGATVQVGSIDGVTDATGLFVAKGDLAGPQAIAIAAAGYTTSAWIGVDGANVTVPLGVPTPSTAPIPSAEVAGTLAGWDAVPTPAADHLTALLVSYSQRAELDADDNSLEPPPSNTQIPSNTCIKALGAPAAACAWRVNVRTGAVAVFGIMLDIDTRGTAASDDDVVTVTGFAKGPTLTVADGADQTGVTLTQLGASDLITASASLGSPPGGLTEHFSLIGVDLGAAGIMRIPPIATSANLVPSLTAVGAESYEFLASASEPGATGTEAQSVVLRRGLTSPASITAGAWLLPPAGLASNRMTASITQVAGAQVHTFDVDGPTGTGGQAPRLMSVLLLDGSTTVELPVDLTTIPAGSKLTGTAVDVGADFDPRDFELTPTTDGLVRLASDAIVMN